MKESTVATALTRADADLSFAGVQLDRCKALQFARQVLKEAQKQAGRWNVYLRLGIGAAIAVLDVAIRLSCEDVEP